MFHRHSFFYLFHLPILPLSDFLLLVMCSTAIAIIEITILILVSADVLPRTPWLRALTLLSCLGIVLTVIPTIYPYLQWFIYRYYFSFSPRLLISNYLAFYLQEVESIFLSSFFLLLLHAIVLLRAQYLRSNDTRPPSTKGEGKLSTK